jgi:hypothetical protein
MPFAAGKVKKPNGFMSEIRKGCAKDFRFQTRTMLHSALFAKAGHRGISNLGETTLVRWKQVDGKSSIGKDKMNFNELRKMAKRMGVNTYRVKKPDIVRSIQREENNIQCFGTSRVEHCCEHECLWRNDCGKLNQNRQPNPG